MTAQLQGFDPSSRLRSRAYFANGGPYFANERITFISGVGTAIGRVPNCFLGEGAARHRRCGVCFRSPVQLGGKSHASPGLEERLFECLHLVECCSEFLDIGEHLSPLSGVGTTKYPSLRDDIEPVTVSVAQAAQLANCSDDTIRRRLRAGRLCGAYQEGVGLGAPWRIPVEALIDEGLCEPGVIDQLDQRIDPEYARIANEVVYLRAELASALTRLEASEKLNATFQAHEEYLRKIIERLMVWFTSVQANGASNGR